MTTKEQERKAIEQIRKIVEGLGENSYVGTAMEGVLEVAEQNIEYDAAFSLKGEKELAEKKEKEQAEIAQNLNKELEALKERCEHVADRHQEELKRLTKQLQEAQALVGKYEMPKEMFEGLYWTISEAKGQAEKDMMEAAITMAGYVGEDTVSTNIHEAAKRFREKRAKAAKCKELLKMLNEKYEIALLA